ncbi:hypothetical protein ACBY01_04595 [Sphingomonas sp. ac-8]|uniref:hypothetical protein n=1 Tax=Sphingomonas sp. ac-8 TaxID=3242977 RepID=UPI003A7FB9A3
MRNGMRGLFLAALLGGCGAPAENAVANAVDAPAPTPSAEAPTAVVAATSEAQAPTIDRSNATGITLLREILVAGGSIDGEQIRDVTLADRCRTTFATDEGATTIDWSHVGNFAGRTTAGTRSIALDDGSGNHVVAVPEGNDPEKGNAGEQLESGFGLLADTCQA